MEYPSGMACQPCLELGMFVGGIVVDDGMDHLAFRNGALDFIEKANELLMAVPSSTLRAVNNVVVPLRL